jgi:two-component system NarL family response regulator
MSNIKPAPKRTVDDHRDDPVSDRGAKKPLSLLIADDHPVVREGLIALLNRRSDMRVIAEANDGRDSVDKFCTQLPDIGLFDIRMPIMDGVEAVSCICRRVPEARIIILTSYQREEDIYRALSAGAKGYLLKDAPLDEIVGCIHTVGDGGTWIPPAIGAQLAKRLTDRQLTSREAEVLRAVAAGKCNKEIGALLNISEATVKVHVTHILGKLRVSGRAEAINVGMRRGLVSVDANSST